MAHVRPTEEAGVSVPDNEQEREANDDVSYFIASFAGLSYGSLTVFT